MRKEATVEVREFDSFGEAVAYLLESWAGLTIVGTSFGAEGGVVMGDLLVWGGEREGGEPDEPRMVGASWTWPLKSYPVGAGQLELRWWRADKPVGGRFVEDTAE